MADTDPKTPKEGPVPDPHAGKPPPAPDPHTRAEPGADMVRPDQQEDLGPVPELFGAAGAEARAYASDDPALARQAIDKGAEAEGLETAQIFGLLLASLVVLVMIVVAVIFMVSVLGQERDVTRQTLLQYDELREVRQTDRERLTTYRRLEGQPGVYAIPLERAQALMAAEARREAVAPDQIHGPTTRTGFNLAYPRSGARDLVAHPDMRAGEVLEPAASPAGAVGDVTADEETSDLEQVQDLDPTPAQPPVP